MVWQENANRIVMLANLKENGKVCDTCVMCVCVCVHVCAYLRRYVWMHRHTNTHMLVKYSTKFLCWQSRCYQYWPDQVGQATTEGIFVIKYHSVEVTADYITRILTIKRGVSIHEYCTFYVCACMLGYMHICMNELVKHAFMHTHTPPTHISFITFSRMTHGRLRSFILSHGKIKANHYMETVHYWPSTEGFTPLMEIAKGQWLYTAGNLVVFSSANEWINKQAKKHICYMILQCRCWKNWDFHSIRHFTAAGYKR